VAHVGLLAQGATEPGAVTCATVKERRVALFPAPIADGVGDAVVNHECRNVLLLDRVVEITH